MLFSAQNSYNFLYLHFTLLSLPDTKKEGKTDSLSLLSRTTIHL